MVIIAGNPSVIGWISSFGLLIHTFRYCVYTDKTASTNFGVRIQNRFNHMILIKYPEMHGNVFDTICIKKICTTSRDITSVIVHLTDSLWQTIYTDFYNRF